MPLNEIQQQYVDDVSTALEQCSYSLDKGVKVRLSIKAPKGGDIGYVSAFYSQARTVAKELIGLVNQLSNENASLRAELASLRNDTTDEQCPCGHDAQNPRGCILSQV